MRKKFSIFLGFIFYGFLCFHDRICIHFVCFKFNSIWEKLVFEMRKSISNWWRGELKGLKSGDGASLSLSLPLLHIIRYIRFLSRWQPIANRLNAITLRKSREIRVDLRRKKRGFGKKRWGAKTSKLLSKSWTFCYLKKCNFISTFSTDFLNLMDIKCWIIICNYIFFHSRTIAKFRKNPHENE